MSTQTAITQQAPPASTAVARAGQDKPSIFRKFATSYDLDPEKVLGIVNQTVFRASGQEPPLTGEEVAAALIVCNAYGLNPFTKEIYAFRSKGRLLVVVGVDGWSNIVNSRPEFNGVEFEEHFDQSGNIHAVTCKIHRKDRAIPTTITEYTRECKRDTDPWNKMPARMTRNRAFVQCARIAFSIGGVVDDDEALSFAGHPELSQPPAPIIEGSTRTETVRNAINASRSKRGNGAEAAKAQPGPPESEPTQTADGSGEVQIAEGEPEQQASEPAAAAAPPAQPQTKDAPKLNESW